MIALVSNLLVLAGFVAASVVGFAFLYRTPVPASNGQLAGPRACVYGPPALIVVGFVLSAAVSLWWTAVVIALVGLGVELALAALGTAHRRLGEDRIAGSALAVVMATATLAMTGMLLAVRLVVSPDPSEVLRGATTGDALREGLGSVLVPLVGTAVLLAVVLVLVRSAHGTGAWPGGAASGPAAMVTRLSVYARETARSWRVRSGGNGVDDETGLPPGRWAYLADAVVLVGATAPAVTGGLKLTFLGFATPEYTKILYIWVVAALLAQYAVLYRPDRGFSLRRLLRRSLLLRPILPFAAFAVGSLLRTDLGPLIPLLVATLTMLATTLYTEARLRGSRGPVAVLDTVGRQARPFLLPIAGIVVLFAAVAYFLPYVATRFRVWQDPWVFNWSSPCIPSDLGTSLPGLPDGAVACQEALSTYDASRSSQIAQSLSAAADGGLWGHGLADSVSGRIPAGSTDFVLAVIWDKLGGAVVLGTAVVTMLLAVAIVRVWHDTRRGDRPVAVTRDRLVATGVAGMLAGQYLFVFAASVNAVPHSGITAPLLSRGGQSALVTLALIVFAVALCYHAALRVRGHSSVHARTATRPVPKTSAGRNGPAVALGLCLLMFAVVLVRPYSGYAEDRPACLGTAALQQPDECSTDRIRASRMPVEVSFAGRVQYRRDPATLRWVPADGAPDLAPADVSGILGGGQAAVLDAGLLQDTVGDRPSSLADRVLPPAFNSSPPARLDLTLDPAIQRSAAQALREDGPGLPLAGGVAVLDARSGNVLAAATAPLPPPDDPSAGTGERVPQTEADRAAAKRRADARARFNADQAAGLRHEGAIVPDPACTGNGPSSLCWHWVATDATRDAGDDTAGLRRYVDDDPLADLPSVGVNRATASRYGPGSTFKVVVAAAYLRRDGTTAEDRHPAPTQIPRAGIAPVTNANKAACAGTGSDGEISLTQAIAVSCNTAFVWLAENILTWQEIRDTAVDLGFSTDANRPSWYPAPRVGTTSIVPESMSGSLANAVLGGAGVETSPLQMASVLGTVADGGTAHAPTLVAAVTSSGEPTETTAPAIRRVLTQAQADQLRTALSRTTDPGGTAAKLRVPASLGQAWVKTGTNELKAAGTGERDRFVYQISWLAGFVETPEGPVSFAAAAETRDERAGADRVRAVVERVLTTIAEARR